MLKFTAAATCICVLSAMAPLSARAASPTLIVSSGQGTATASPDKATLSVSIETNNDSAAQAASQNNVIYNRLIAGLGAIGVSKDKIHTTGYNMYFTPRPANEIPSGYQPRYGYVVNRNISADLPSASVSGEAVDAANSAGVTNIGGVSYSVSNENGLSTRALALAVADARARAQAMAAAGGLHIVRIRQIQEGEYQRPVPLMMRAMAAGVAPAPAPPTELPAQNVSASATVTITFEAQ